MNVAVSRRGKTLLWLAFSLLVITLYAPILVLIIFSFNDREIVSFPWEGFTVRWYQTFIENQEIVEALTASAKIAAVTSVVTTVLAIPASIALARRRFLAKGLVSGALMAPLVIPLVVLGTALLILFNFLGFPFGPLALIDRPRRDHAIPFAILTILPRLERIPVASRRRGVTSARTGGWRSGT